MRITTDVIAFCREKLPRFNPISISGYHIREAGSTAGQELGFTLANGIAYVEAAVEAGLDVDDFGKRLSFFFNSHRNFLEEIAKFRAARRLWGKILRERFDSKNPRAQMLRFHTQTAGSSLTGPAADRERRAYDAPGARRRSRRNPVASLQRPRRSARSPDGTDRGAGAENAAGDCVRERRAGDRRSARRPPTPSSR